MTYFMWSSLEPVLTVMISSRNEKVFCRPINLEPIPFWELSRHVSQAIKSILKTMGSWFIVDINRENNIDGNLLKIP